jgi:hypothetical protein
LRPTAPDLECELTPASGRSGKIGMSEFQKCLAWGLGVGFPALVLGVFLSLDTIAGDKEPGPISITLLWPWTLLYQLHKLIEHDPEWPCGMAIVVQIAGYAVLTALVRRSYRWMARQLVTDEGDRPTSVHFPCDGFAS